MRTRTNRPSRLFFALVLASAPAALLLASGRAVAADEARAALKQGPDADLPIRTIVLYRSGVGYFERQGTVQGDQRASLKFETRQVNDILKSMVLLDLDGGKIGAVTYGSKEPLDRRLASFGVDISGAPSIADLFRQLRGAKISATGPDGVIEGTILGVETRPVAPPQTTGGGQPGQPFMDSFVTIVAPTGVKAVRIAQISSFNFADAELNNELAKALAAIAEQRAENTKAVDVAFNGDAGKARRVVVAYIHEMPVWKTSYRLVLPDETKGAAPDAKKKSTMTLQGWAIVENTTDQDWKDVRLSLASGRPVSFTMDLYQPLFTTRPDVPVPFLAGVAPRVYESAANLQSMAVIPQGGAARESARNELAMRKSKERFADGEAAPAAASDQAWTPLSSDDFTSYAAQSQASAGEAGETFMYTLDVPVTLERQRSAMLPILTTPVEGQRVSIYNAAAFAKHPMRGVKITNADTHLMPGPISVYDGAAYAGDAQIPHTSRAQERLLSYAVDLDVLGEMESAGAETINKIKIVDGLLHFESKYRTTATYKLTNNDAARSRLVLIEHPRSDGWDLIEPKEPAETTENLYRFQLPLDAGKSASLKVVQEQGRVQQYTLIDYDLNTLLAYSKQGKASPAVADAMKKAAAINARIREQSRRIDDLESRRHEIAGEQDRIRSNMNSLDRNSDLYRRYTSKLNEQETQVEGLLSQRDEAQTARLAAEKELRDYLRDLDVE
ncbi:MAG: hypothetical protein JNK58_00780 [Phycisphaerae bacterium]|nr:hypothetical protein [Phycisphaerae bacterium]